LLNERVELAGRDDRGQGGWLHTGNHLSDRLAVHLLSHPTADLDGRGHRGGSARDLRAHPHQIVQLALKEPDVG
jgi:hypothetical protein